MKTIHKFGALVVIANTIVGYSKVEAVPDFMRDSFNDGSSPRQEREYQEQKIKRQEQLTNECTQIIAIYNKMVAAYKEVVALLGNDYQYYYAVDRKNATRLKTAANRLSSLSEYLSMKDIACYDYVTIWEDGRRTTFLGDKENDLKEWNEILQYVKTHLDKIKQLIDYAKRKPVLYNQAVSVIKEIETLVDNDSKYYDDLDPNYSANFKKVINVLNDISKNNFSKYTDETVVKTVQKYLEIAQQALDFVKKHQAGVKHLADEFKRKAPLYNQAMAIIKEANSLFVGTYYQNSDLFLQAAAVFTKPEKEYLAQPYEQISKAFATLRDEFQHAKAEFGDRKTHIDEENKKSLSYNKAMEIIKESNNLFAGTYYQNSDLFLKAAAIFIKKPNQYFAQSYEEISKALDTMQDEFQKMKAKKELDELKTERQKMHVDLSKIYNSLSAEEKQEIDGLLKPAKEL